MNVKTILATKGKGVVTIGPGQTVREAAVLMAKHDIGAVVVTDGTGPPIGILSERDIVQELARAGTTVMDAPVEACMTKSVVSCREADTTDQLMGEMTAHRFRHMPVVERGRLVGLVSIGEVVRMRIAEAEMEAAAMREYIATG